MKRKGLPLEGFKYKEVKANLDEFAGLGFPVTAKINRLYKYHSDLVRADMVERFPEMWKCGSGNNSRSPNPGKDHPFNKMIMADVEYE